MKEAYGPLWRDSKLKFTEEGEKKARLFVKEALAKRKEILGAKKDEAGWTPEPTVEGLLEEVETEGFDAFGGCQISVSVTDSFETDRPFDVDHGKDVCWAPMPSDEKKEALEGAWEEARKAFAESLRNSGFLEVGEFDDGSVGWKDPESGEMVGAVFK